MRNLQSRLDEFKREFESGAPPYNATNKVIETMHRATGELEASGLANKALKTRDRAPRFSLFNQDHVEVNSADRFGKAPWWLAFSGDTGDPIAIWSWRLYREFILRSRPRERRSWC